MQFTLPQFVKTWFGTRDEVQHPHKRYHDEDWHTPRGRQIREVVFGMNDGLVSTVGFVSGVTGSINNSRIILFTGMAAMLAGAVSMFLGAYLASKSQIEFFEREIEREKREIAEYPEKERQEIRDIFTDHGFTEDEVEMIVHRVTSDKDRWIKFMMRDELGIVDEDFESPVKAGVIMSASFITGGLPLILPYLFISESLSALKLSILIALVILLGLGIGKTVITKTHWLKSSAETVLLGSVAAGVGYIFGRIFSVSI